MGFQGHRREPHSYNRSRYLSFGPRRRQSVPTTSDNLFRVWFRGSRPSASVTSRRPGGPSPPSPRDPAPREPACPRRGRPTGGANPLARPLPGSDWGPRGAAARAPGALSRYAVEAAQSRKDLPVDKTHDNPRRTLGRDRSAGGTDPFGPRTGRRWAGVSPGKGHKPRRPTAVRKRDASLGRALAGFCRRASTPIELIQAD